MLTENFVPSQESLCYGLDNLKKINSQYLSTEGTKKIHIIQSENDQISDLEYLVNFEKKKFRIHTLKDLSHYPFFDFDQICEIIKKEYEKQNK